MNYLSLGLMQKDLAHRFKIHQSTVSRIINTWANFLYTVLGAVCIWLGEETVKAHLPDIFQDYPDTQVILDCTKLHCQTPNSLLLQSEVFSGYKSHCTFKGLIGVAPHGAVTFISSLYQGSISDKEILKQSGIVALMNPSMAIMVDKGFLVEDCVPCKVHIPTFLSKRAQLSGPEVKKTQSIARLRVQSAWCAGWRNTRYSVQSPPFHSASTNFTQLLVFWSTIKMGHWLKPGQTTANVHTEIDRW